MVIKIESCFNVVNLIAKFVTSLRISPSFDIIKDLRKRLNAGLLIFSILSEGLEVVVVEFAFDYQVAIFFCIMDVFIPQGRRQRNYRLKSQIVHFVCETQILPR